MCEKWGLPPTGLKDLSPVQLPEQMKAPKRKRLLQRTLSDLPHSHGPDTPVLEWWRNGLCLTFIVDCKPLADVMGGHAPLKALACEPVLERMTQRLFKTFAVGWTSHRRAADPVLWHRRESNLIADFLVNYTMDIAHDWFYEYLEETAELDVLSSNLVCHSDGGTRGESCSAAAWFLEAIYIQDGLR